MEKNDVVWPWGMSDQDPDPATRPWVFHPQGFLLTVLEDAGEAERAQADLRRVGFAEGHLRIYSGPQLLDERERFLATQTLGRRLVEKLTIDNEAVELLLDYAREGRSFLWVRVPDRGDANRAIRFLSDRKVLYYRYYGDSGVEEIRMP